MLEIVLIALALAMDCFTVSTVCGMIAGDRRVTAPRSSGNGGSVSALRLALLFGVFQAMMPLIGWFLTSRFSEQLQAVDHWIAFAMLAFMGGKMIVEAFKEEEEKTMDPGRLKTQLVLAVATSIDALAIGISFACTGYDTIDQLVVPLIMIGAVSFVMSIVGSELGKKFGAGITKKIRPELLGGLILIAIGVKVLVEHLS
ncbi:MAG: manganese efflux pump [Bacteroidales bacterium]|nr:manganese efflux pump [Bacteroidales bacterium]